MGCCFTSTAVQGFKLTFFKKNIWLMYRIIFGSTMIQWGSLEILRLPPLREAALFAENIARRCCLYFYIDKEIWCYFSVSFNSFLCKPKFSTMGAILVWNTPYVLNDLAWLKLIELDHLLVGRHLSSFVYSALPLKF